MSAATIIDAPEVERLFTELLGRDVFVSKADSPDVHPATLCGLVSDDDALVGVVACDLTLAHMSGAALARIPRGAVEDHGDSPHDEWLEFYREVANVLSRVVNEASPTRVRLDPGMEHDDAALTAIVESDSVRSFKVSIDGYGDGVLTLGAAIA